MINYNLAKAYLGMPTKSCFFFLELFQKGVEGGSEIGLQLKFFNFSMRIEIQVIKIHTMKRKI